MRVDSHQHFWKRSRGDYDWLTSKLEPIYRDFLPDDLSVLLKNNNISKTVVVQAAPTVSETEFLLELAAKTEFIAGVVGWVDMEADDVLETIKDLSKNPYFKGIRPMIQDISDPTWMLRAKLAPVFQHLSDAGLCFDALVHPKHLHNLLKLLKDYPHLKAVIDHGAKPRISEGNFKTHPWAEDIQQLALETNACCKLSGLLTEARLGATVEDIYPYVKHLINCFGSKRIMWGSDWPVLNLASNYSRWMDISLESLRDLSAEDIEHVLGINATKFYNLDIESTSGL